MTNLEDALRDDPNNDVNPSSFDDIIDDHMEDMLDDYEDDNCDKHISDDDELGRKMKLVGNEENIKNRIKFKK